MELFDADTEKLAVGLLADKSEAIWNRAYRGIRCSDLFEPWIGGMALKCADSLQDFYGAPKDSPQIPRDIQSMLWEFLRRKKQKLASGLAYKRWRDNPVPGQESQLLDEFLDKVVAAFKNECHDMWRNTPGTFSSVYRDCQTKLKEYLPPRNWKLCGAMNAALNSQFYAPAEAADAGPAIDEKDHKKLAQVDLPPGAPGCGVLFKEPLASLAIHLHRSLADQEYPPPDLRHGDVKVAVRTFAAWLCGKYPLLDPRLDPQTSRNFLSGTAMEDEAGSIKDEWDEVAAPAPCELDEMRKEVLTRAADAVFLKMPPDFRRLFRAKHVDGLPEHEIAGVLGLSNASAVARQNRRLQNFMRDEMNKIPDIFDSVSEEICRDRAPATIYAEFFISVLQAHAHEVPYV